jgi:hypothetical protein
MTHPVKNWTNLAHGWTLGRLLQRLLRAALSLLQLLLHLSLLPSRSSWHSSRPQQCLLLLPLLVAAILMAAVLVAAVQGQALTALTATAAGMTAKVRVGVTQAAVQMTAAAAVRAAVMATLTLTQAAVLAAPALAAVGLIQAQRRMKALQRTPVAAAVLMRAIQGLRTNLVLLQVSWADHLCSSRLGLLLGV